MILGEFKVIFQHNPSFSSVIPNTGGRYRYKGQTSCFVQNNNNEVIGQAVVNCPASDLYTKKQGRKISLSKAIATLPRAVRTQIWRDYWLAITPPVVITEEAAA